MNIKEVKDLIHEVLQSDISEFELENTGTRIRLKRGFGKDLSIPLPHRPQSAAGMSPGASLGDFIPASARTDQVEDTGDSTLHIITSPIVGTAFCAAAPGSEPFVKLGDHVKENTVLCIVEAMKLMNEIPSDVAGEVVHIFIENGTPVEFGQKLFAIRPSK
jgi:acetyl-CoA carboxylase biotin carboxyl carrier protein